MNKYLLLLTALTTLNTKAQTDPAHKKIYGVQLKYELPVSAAAVFASVAGFKKLDKLSAMTATDVLKLNAANINAWDRPIALLNPAGFSAAQTKSDLFLSIALCSPLLLGLDRKIRKDWLDLLSLYLVSHAADNSLYFAGTFSVRKPRPFTYNQMLDISEKIGNGKSSSFFSGHVAFSATATFFTAKVYTDYHHIKGWERILIYTAAAIPPALVGYYRMRAGKHFKTDVIVGLLSGASSGILVPEFHRLKKKHAVSVVPYYVPGGAGVSITKRF